MSVRWWLRLRERWDGVNSHDRSGVRSSRNRAESAASAGGTRQRVLADGGGRSADTESGILTARRVGILLFVLAAGQALGILITVTQSQQLISTIDTIRFLYAIPLFDVIYYPVVFPAPSTALPVLFGLGYLAVYAVTGLHMLRNDGVPDRFKRPLQLFFAGNAVLYAISPVLMTRAFTQAGFANFSIVEYYTDGLVIPLILVYGVLMGVLYVATERFTGPADGAIPTERTDQGERGAETTAGKTTHRSSETRLDEPTRSESREVNASHDTQGQHTTTETQPSEQKPNTATEPTPSPDQSPPGRSPKAERSLSPNQPPTENTALTDQEPAAETAENSTPPATESQRSDTGTDTTGSAAHAGPTGMGSDDDDTDDEISNLLSALDSGDRSQRLAAAERLDERIRDDPEAVDADSLANAFDAEPDPEIRKAILNAVGALDSDAADDVLREARFDPNPSVSDRASGLLD